MNTEPRHRAVVVGVDAYESAFRAARFAADEAVRRALPLRIVHARTRFDGMTHPHPELDVPGMLTGGAQSVLQAVSDAVADMVPADRLSTSVVDGKPADVLVDASADASLVVVGGRGVGGIAGLLLGSTSHGVVGRALCPVVVVPDDAAVQARDRRSVVVGIEGRGDEVVLAFAFAEAAARGTDLVAVHAWQDVVLDTAFQSISPLMDWAGVMADEERVLAEALAGWRDKEPDVSVHEVVVREKTARALVEVSLTAQLLVVGHHRGRTLGSTTHGALHRASCPVAVVPLAAAGAAAAGESR
jgi:nucleotide-binding universal stress UspA family protein